MEQPTKTDKAYLGAYVPCDHIDILKALAAADRRSLSELVRVSIEQYLRRRGAVE